MQLDKIDFRRAETGDIPQLVALRLAFLRENGGPLTQQKTEELTARLTESFGRLRNKTMFGYLAVTRTGQAVSAAVLAVADKPASPTRPQASLERFTVSIPGRHIVGGACPRR